MRLLLALSAILLFLAVTAPIALPAALAAFVWTVAQVGWNMGIDWTERLVGRMTALPKWIKREDDR